MTRNEALIKLEENPYDEDLMKSDMEYIAKKLGISVDEFITIINGENKSYKNYKNSLSMIELSIKVAKMVGVEKRNFR